MSVPTKRTLPNQQTGRRQRQRIIRTHRTSKQSNSTCTSTIDVSTLPCMGTLNETIPPLLLPIIPTLPPNMEQRTIANHAADHVHDARPNVQSTVISPVHTGNTNKRYVRPPPSKQETTDNLDPSILATLDASQDAYKSTLSDFERNHNVHTPPQNSLPSGHEIERRCYRFHHGAQWTDTEETVFYDTIKQTAENPIQRKKGEKKLGFWKRVQIAMKTSRTTEALSAHFSAIINNKMKTKHPRFSEFCALKQLIDGSKLDQADSTKQGTINRYTAMLEMKAKNKAARKREKEAKKDKLDENINTVCELFKKEMEMHSQQNEESDTQWRRRNIMHIRDGLDLIAANTENHVLAKDAQKLQKALLSKDNAESIIIEYQRLKQKELSTKSIIAKLIELAKLM